MRRFPWIMVAVAASGCNGDAASLRERDCRYPWTLNGQWLCEGDLDAVASTWARDKVADCEIRPGTHYQRCGPALWSRASFDPRWLGDLGLGVWLHGDDQPRLRSLRGLGSGRLRAMGRFCPHRSCCDLGQLKGVGVKTLARWSKRAKAHRSELACVFWHDGAFSLGACRDDARDLCAWPRPPQSAPGAL